LNASIVLDAIVSVSSVYFRFYVEPTYTYATYRHTVKRLCHSRHYVTIRGSLC